MSVDTDFEDESLSDVLLKYAKFRYARLLESWFFTHPCESFFAWLAWVKGVPAICGIYISISGPETGYPMWLYVTWGVQMVVSALGITIGLWKHSFNIRILGFKLLTIATIFNLLAILCTHPTTRPSYITLYVGFVFFCAIKVVSISHEEDLLEKK